MELATYLAKHPPAHVSLVMIAKALSGSNEGTEPPARMATAEEMAALAAQLNAR